MLTPRDQPFFSVIISTLDRRDLVQRCVESCLSQNFDGLETIVVDDGSADGTSEALRERWSDVQVITHDASRGISAARASGARAARGRWILVLDSDWLLLPGTLQRLYEIVLHADEDIGVVRARMLWEGVEALPHDFPTRRVGYAERIEFAADTLGLDLSSCIRADVLERNPYLEHRADSFLFEFNLAKVTTSLFVEDIFIAEYTDAPNSWLRSTDFSTVVPQMLRAAPDLLYELEAILRDHGEQIRESGAALLPILLRSAATQAFLCGRRSQGLRYVIRAFRNRNQSFGLFATALLGIIGPRPVAYGAVCLRYAKRLSSDHSEKHD